MLEMFLQVQTGNISLQTHVHECLPLIIYYRTLEDAADRCCGYLITDAHLNLCSVLAGHMTDLLYTEKDLVTSLKDYIKAEESKLEQLKQ